MNVKKFVYLNYTLHNNTNQTGFRISLDLNYTISSTHNDIDVFHIYILRPYSIPHFDFLNNPAVNTSQLIFSYVAQDMVQLFVMIMNHIQLRKNLIRKSFLRLIPYIALDFN